MTVPFADNVVNTNRHHNILCRTATPCGGVFAQRVHSARTAPIIFFIFFLLRLNKFKECNVSSQATTWFKK